MTLLTTKAFAARCGVEPETVRRWVRDRKLEPRGRTPGGQLRFEEAQVEELLRAGLAAGGRAQGLERHVLAARARLRLRA